MTTEERGIHRRMLWDVDLETFIYLVGKKCTKAITKGLYIRDIKFVVIYWKWRMDCWKKSMLLGFYYWRYPVWLAFFVVETEPMSRQKIMGEGARGEGNENDHLQSIPWDLWNAPSSLVKGVVGLHVMWHALKCDVSHHTM